LSNSALDLCVNRPKVGDDALLIERRCVDHGVVPFGEVASGEKSSAYGNANRGYDECRPESVRSAGADSP
jgi:hypothetical protein